MSGDSAARPIDLLVLDDHAIVRQGVMLLVQQHDWIARCRGAASIDEAMRLMEEAPADAAVVDLSLKRQSGLDAIKSLLQRWPALPIVVLSMHVDPVHRQHALQRGAMGFVAKDDASDELVEALRRAVAHERYLSSSVRSLRLGDPAGPGHAESLTFDEALAQLTKREREVLVLVGRGRSASEVAAEIGRSVKTVEAHRNNLREKLGFKNNRQLLQFSARWVQFDESE
jgi:DNA-binding NarL/FixJ family response regulator